MTDAELKRALLAWTEEARAFGLDAIPAGPEFVESEPEPVAEAAAPVDVAARERVAAPAATSEPEPSPAPAAVPERGAGALAAIAAEASNCRLCGLCETRTKVVPGQGSATARMLFVGEAPGADEDRQGLAFVGRSGELLTKMIGALGFERDEVFIANVLKCRPPENRDPAPPEVARCLPFLQRQIQAIQPEVLVALGGHAARGLLGVEDGVGRLRGRMHEFEGKPVVVTYHPAYLLRNPSSKRAAWQDLKLALGVLGLEPPAAPRAR